MGVSYFFAYQGTQNDFFYHDGQVKNSQNLTQQSTKFLEGNQWVVLTRRGESFFNALKNQYLPLAH